MKKLVLFLLVLFIVFESFSWYYMLSLPRIFTSPTGSATTGFISLIIAGDLNKHIFIDSPLNTTYFFAFTEPYLIDLNVSSDFVAGSWWYSLFDARHNRSVLTNISFLGNITITAVRWSNILTVYANDSFGDIVSKSVTFNVWTPNSAPVFENVSSHLFVCEGQEIRQGINASDYDEDDLIFDISPKDPFFIGDVERLNYTRMRAFIISSNLTKAFVGEYSESLTVTDGFLSDLKLVNISVIELNHPPDITPVGVHTIFPRGENSTFSHFTEVIDLEDGNSFSGNLTFSLIFEGEPALFTIRSDGFMNWSGNETKIGVHNISVCAMDRGLASSHPNISLCGQTGNPKTTCSNFSITVTDQNRKPTITSFNPNYLNFSAWGNETLIFNVSMYDPDWTIPDSLWYVDGILRHTTSGISVASFTHIFGCDVSGNHSVEVVITDGLETDSLRWNITVRQVNCPIPSSKGGGGGGVQKNICLSQWGCLDWNICQNVMQSLSIGALSGSDYRSVQIECRLGYLDEANCGYRLRTCGDLRGCNITTGRPPEMQICQYTPVPGCTDGIKNCHSKSCEILTDCGGPCSPCPTCSDGKRNQNEKGVDCGGPCPFVCPPDKPLISLIPWWYFALAIALILLIVLSVKIVHIQILKHRIIKD